MLRLTPVQIVDLGRELANFIHAYPPNEIDAVLFLDHHGVFGSSAGPDAPSECRIVINRAGVDCLMVLHTYTTLDLGETLGREAFAQLVSGGVVDDLTDQPDVGVCCTTTNGCWDASGDRVARLTLTPGQVSELRLRCAVTRCTAYVGLYHQTRSESSWREAR